MFILYDLILHNVAIFVNADICAYFVDKTRQQEIIDNFDSLSEEQRRLPIRNEMIKHNILLADAANKVGVVAPLDHVIFKIMATRDFMVEWA